ncbi:hypothetical protein [Georgenia thermotolerans]|uniref:hypothetical protein n=1 Tax=Georgenia thermotolerans TaxID=527326 RepID=UPI00186B31E8|nr:hypothetical protein [Georgenia thermotolerans]
MTFLVPDDLAAFADIEPVKAQAMIEDAEAMAALAAPCITNPDFAADAALLGALKAILRAAILRWNDTGSGAVTQIGAGSFQQTIDTRSGVRRGMFWPSEIEQLRDLCAKFSGNADDDAAFMVNMTPDAPVPSLASRPDLWFQWVNPTPPGAP